MKANALVTTAIYARRALYRQLRSFEGRLYFPKRHQWCYARPAPLPDAVPHWAMTPDAFFPSGTFSLTARTGTRASTCSPREAPTRPRTARASSYFHFLPRRRRLSRHIYSLSVVS